MLERSGERGCYSCEYGACREAGATADHAAERMVRISAGRIVELSRTALLYRVAGYQNPLQADRHRRSLGRAAAIDDHADLQLVFRQAGACAVGWIAVRDFLLQRAAA